MTLHFGMWTVIELFSIHNSSELRPLNYIRTVLQNLGFFRRGMPCCGSDLQVLNQKMASFVT
jgi:hypothetical protein